MTDKKGTRVLYVKLQKVLYGLMQASLLFYRKLRKELKGYGLIVNPYDPCVANMLTKGGKQLTVVWHVDDLMIMVCARTTLNCQSSRAIGETSMEQS